MLLSTARRMSVRKLLMQDVSVGF